MPTFKGEERRGDREIVFWRFKRNQERKFSLKTREENIFKELNVIGAAGNKIRNEKGQLVGAVSRS